MALSLIWPTEADREAAMEEFLNVHVGGMRRIQTDVAEIQESLCALGLVDLGSLASLGELLEAEAEATLKGLQALTTAIQSAIASKPASPEEEALLPPE